MKEKNPLVAIVIVNYNGLSDTLECLSSVSKICYDNFKVIVVDNASNDDSINKLRKKYPYAIYITNSINLGFTGGNNIGFKEAYKLGAKYIFCLNNDIVISENSLRELTLFLERNPRVGLIGPLTCYYDDKETIAFAGGNINRNTGLISLINKEKKRSDITEIFVPCTFVEGAAILIRADLLKKIGGFNEEYFLTSEESELCVKVNDLGYELGVLTTCCIWHKVSKSMVAESELSTYFIFRNKLYFVRYNNHDLTIFDLLKIIHYYLICFLSFTLKKRNFGASKGLLTGVIDFYVGRTGAGRFAKVLQK
jgi:GT2 family glycosyltransferase